MADGSKMSLRNDALEGGGACKIDVVVMWQGACKLRGIWRHLGGVVNGCMSIPAAVSVSSSASLS